MEGSRTPDDATAAADPNLRFVLWALDALDLELVLLGDDGYLLTLPPEDRDAFDGAEQIRFAGETAGQMAAAGDLVAGQPGEEYAAEPLTADGRLVAWLSERLNRQGPFHAAPRTQPESVHELTPQLFEPYTVEGGRVHLGGCRLEDVPLFRVTLRITPRGGGAARLQDVFVDQEGKLVDRALQAELGLDDVRALPRAPQRVDPGRLADQLSAARQKAAAGGQVEGAASAEVMAAVVVWCKYAWIKLSFVIGDQTRYVEFDGWARSIADGRVPPPPFVCPQTGVASYRIAADDDGRVTAAEAIVECEESGRKVLSSELATCAATGRRIHPSLTATCPVSRQVIARSSAVACGMCGQQVSPTAVRGGRCSACRDLQPLSKADPRMARVLDEHPGLDRWRSWKIAETEAVYVLVATALFRRLLVVIDRESLEPLRVATGTRFGSAWSEATGLTRQELLG